MKVWVGGIIAETNKMRPWPTTPNVQEMFRPVGRHRDRGERKMKGHFSRYLRSKKGERLGVGLGRAGGGGCGQVARRSHRVVDTVRSDETPPPGGVEGKGPWRGLH